MPHYYRCHLYPNRVMFLLPSLTTHSPAEQIIPILERELAELDAGTLPNDRQGIPRLREFLTDMLRRLRLGLPLASEYSYRVEDAPQ